MKGNAIGVIEVNYFSKAMVVFDSMLKAADVEIVSYHKRLGGRMTHGVVAGLTSDVEAAICAAQESRKVIGEQHLKVAVTISNPHSEVLKLLNMINEKESGRR